MASIYAGSQGLMDTAKQAGQLQGQRLTNAAQQYSDGASGGPAAGQGPFAGMTPTQKLALEVRNPGKLEEMQSAWNLQQGKPTDATLTGQQAGLPPELVQASNARALDKSLSNFKEDREGRIWDLTKGALVGVAPNLAPGSTYGPIGTNGFPSSAQSFPGGPQSYQNAAFAQASGAAGGGIGQYQSPAGGQVPAYGINAAGPLPRIPTVMGGPQAPGQPPGPQGATPPQQMPQQAPQVPPQQFGQTTSNSQIQQAGGQRIAALPQQQVALSQARTGLEQALALTDKLPASGPGSEGPMRWLAIASNLPGGAGLKDPVAAFQLVHKYLSNAQLVSAQTTGANSSDVKFEASQAANPSEQAMNVPALKASIRYVLSQVDAGVAGAKFQTDAYSQLASRDPNAAQTAQQKWANVYDPTVFAYNRMDKPERAQFLQGLGFKPGVPAAQQPPAVQQFYQKYNTSAQAGWVK
jgi:hypothetical protein